MSSARANGWGYGIMAMKITPNHGHNKWSGGSGGVSISPTSYIYSMVSADDLRCCGSLLTVG